MKQQRISGKEATRVAEDMAKPGPIRVVAASEAQEAPGALVPSPGSELDRKMPPRVRKLLPRNDQWKAPTPDLEGHRKRLREALQQSRMDIRFAPIGDQVATLANELVALRPRSDPRTFRAGHQCFAAGNARDPDCIRQRLRPDRRRLREANLGAPGGNLTGLLQSYDDYKGGRAT